MRSEPYATNPLTSPSQLADLQHSLDQYHTSAAKQEQERLATWQEREVEHAKILERQRMAAAAKEDELGLAYERLRVSATAKESELMATLEQQRTEAAAHASQFNATLSQQRAQAELAEAVKGQVSTAAPRHTLVGIDKCRQKLRPMKCMRVHVRDCAQVAAEVESKRLEVEKLKRQLQSERSEMTEAHAQEMQTLTRQHAEEIRSVQEYMEDEIKESKTVHVVKKQELEKRLALSRASSDKNLALSREALQQCEEDKEAVQRELERTSLRERMLRAELEASTRERAEAKSAVSGLQAEVSELRQAALDRASDRFARASAEAEIARLRQALDEAHECSQRLEARAVHFDEQYRRLWRATHDPVYVAATGKAPNEGFRAPPTRREREVVERRESRELESLLSYSKSRTESDSMDEDDDESLNAPLGSSSSSSRATLLAETYCWDMESLPRFMDSFLQWDVERFDRFVRGKPSAVEYYPHYYTVPHYHRPHKRYDSWSRNAAFALVCNLVSGLDPYGTPLDPSLPQTHYIPLGDEEWTATPLPNILELLLCHDEASVEFRESTLPSERDFERQSNLISCTVELLLAMGMPADGCVHPQDGRGVKMGLLHMLASGGCQPDIWDDTPLPVLVESQLSVLVALCTICGADVELADEMHGAGPLGWACWFGSSSGCHAMLVAKANGDARDAYDCTPFDNALRHGWNAGELLQRVTPGRRDFFPRREILACQTTRANVLALRRAHAQWAEADARMASALTAYNAARACEACIGRTLPGPALQAVADASMPHYFTCWRPVTQPVITEGLR